MDIKWVDKTLRALWVEKETYYSHPVEGLRLRVYPTARGEYRKVWQYDRRIDGKRVKISLGTFPALGLADAVQKSLEANRRVALGMEPFPAPEKIVLPMTVKEAWELYLADRKRVGKDLRVIESLGETDIVGGIGDMAMLDVTPDIITRKVMARPLERAKTGHRAGVTGNTVAANNALRLTITLFDWCIKRRVVDGLVWNPAKAIEPMKTSGHKPPRVLTEREMALAILAAREFDRERPLVKRFGRRRPQNTNWTDILTILMCLGSRKSEVLEMRKDEWDSAAKVWRLPAARYKTDRDCHLPVGPMVAAIFDRLASRDDESPWMIPYQIGVRTGSDTPVVKAITRHMVAIGGEPVVPWSLHKTRYGFRSNIRKAKIADSELAERIIHPKAQQAMDQHYDPDRFDEIRDALTAWERHLMSAVDAIAASRLKAVA